MHLSVLNHYFANLILMSGKHFLLATFVQIEPLALISTES